MKKVTKTFPWAQHNSIALEVFSRDARREKQALSTPPRGNGQNPQTIYAILRNFWISQLYCPTPPRLLRPSHPSYFPTYYKGALNMTTLMAKGQHYKLYDKTPSRCL